MMKLKYLIGQACVLGLALNFQSNQTLAKSPRVITAERPNEFWLSQIRLPRTNSGRPGSTAGAGTRLYLPSPDESLRNGSVGAGIDWTSPVRGGETDSGNLNLFMLSLPTFQPSFCSDAQPLSLFQSNSQKLTTTLSRHGTLWFAIPAPNLTAIAQVKFRLFDFSSGEVLYEKNLEYGTDQAGLLRIDLPENSLGEEGLIYDWDLQLVCQDQSVSVPIEGQLSYSNWTDPDVLFFSDNYANIVDTLSTEDSYLSFTPKEREYILDDLNNNNPWKALFRFQILLGEHLRNLQRDYGDLNQAIAELSIQTELENEDQETLAQLKAERKQMVLEMVQIQVWFGAWSDALNLLLTHREEYPEEWHLFLETMLDDGSMVQDELLPMLEQLPVVTPDSPR